MVRRLPLPAWVRGYQRRWLRGDLIAGVTVTAYLLPQVMAYADVAGMPAVWMLLLLAPLGALALLSVFTRRWLAGGALLLVAALGIVTAFIVVGVAVSVADGAAVPIWPGTALSLAWAGVVGAAALTLDTGFARHPSADADRALPAGRPRVLVATALMLALGVFALPALTAHLRGASALTDGPASTLPAFVSAEGHSRPDTGTLVLQPLADGGVGARVVWGESATLGGQSTVLATRTALDAHDRQLANLAGDLVSPSSSDVVQRLEADSIGFVLLAPADQTADPARALRLTAVTALNQRAGLDSVGDTDKGTLWRVTGGVAERAEASPAVMSLARAIMLFQLIAVGAGLLLAVPTGASRRRARYTSRVVGRREADAVAVAASFAPADEAVDEEDAA